ncbi:MFS transporter [Solirubrobacter sp. CPCC 204708]|uniref:MFS transporter n=1 Tax=Solirubrobacter deserti TaxID=2282478 RepID=A0ABT4RUV8_9ACTN|nr:MFS transporter [Solirubrobacter deserti]MBE2320743.1 MFS transporter [Solirubrobacter deserti]MDA0142354.1 MFS transporter [Solirubrobacter deserti]
MSSPWRTTLLAGSASYLDAGSIVAGAVALPLWTEHFGFGTTLVGLIGAFSSNAISAGVGALAGGWLCDKLGRRRVYQWDLLLYAFGLLCIIFATEPWMLVFGYVFTGLAVGIDVPASWTLIAEAAPKGQHGRHGATAQIMWLTGPLVVLLMGLALADAGLRGVRLIFAHLLVLSLAVWFFRRTLVESPLWERQASHAHITLASFKQLLKRPFLAPLVMLTAMYGLWNLHAGTSGFYLPYILRTIGSQTQAASVALNAFLFVLGGLSVYFVFMPRADRGRRTPLFATAATMQIAAVVLLALLELTTGIAILYVLISGLCGGFGQQQFFQLWSAEAFPTLLRATALGLMFAVVRIALGGWSLILPHFLEAGFHGVAWTLIAFLTASALVGLAYARRVASSTIT